MKRYWLKFAMLFAMAATGAELDMQWSAAGASKVQAVSGMLSATLTSGGYDSRVIGTPAVASTLNGNRELVLQARIADGASQRVGIWLERRLNGENNAFISYIEVGTEWRSYRFPLNRGNELPENGCFGYWRDKPGKEPDLGLGGELTALAVFADVPTVVELRSVALTREEAPISGELEALRRQINEHPTIRPYTFEQVDPMVRLVLAQDGKTSWFISIAPDADATVRFAAQELASYLQRVTGAVFPVRESGGVNSIRLSVEPGGDGDGFRSRGDAAEIELIGESARGVLFGVYDFLEKAAGVRWYAPLAYGEVVPSRPNLELSGFRDASAPVFEMRRSHYCSWRGKADYRGHGLAMADWIVKNRFNVVLERFEGDTPGAVAEFYRKRGNPYKMQWVPGHNFSILIPPGEYGVSHPEYFAFNRESGQWQTAEAQLCASNVELQQLLAEKAEEYFAVNPQEKYFPLFQEDGYARWCQCPGCEAIASTDTGKFAGATDRNLHLANQVCRLIRRKHPDKGVITFAYSFSAKLPQRVSPDPEVRVLYCYYNDGFPEKMPWQNRNAEELLEWNRLTGGNMATYTYHYLNPALVMAEPDSLTAAFRFFALLRQRGTVQESSESWSAPDAYLIYLGGRLAWNPWVDEKELRAEYFNGLYGAAGASVQRYWEVMNAAMRFAPGRQTFVVWSFFPAVSDEALAEMDAALALAEQEAAGDARSAQAVAAQREYYDLFAQVVAVSRLLEQHQRAPEKMDQEVIRQELDRMTELARPLWESHGLAHYGEKRLLGNWFDGWEASQKKAQPAL